MSSVVAEEQKLTECKFDETSINKFDANQAAFAKEIVMDHEIRCQLNETEPEPDDGWCGPRWKRHVSPCLSSPVTPEHTEQENYLELGRMPATYGRYAQYTVDESDISVSLPQDMEDKTSAKKPKDSDYHSEVGYTSHKLHERQREHELQAQTTSDQNHATQLHVIARANANSVIYLQHETNHDIRMHRLNGIALDQQQL